MKIGSLLLNVGKAALKDVPGGNIIAEVAAIAVDEKFPVDITGEAVMSKIKDKLPLDKADLLLNRTLSPELVTEASWAVVKDQLAAPDVTTKTKRIGFYIIAIATAIAEVLVGGVLVANYMSAGTVPDATTLSSLFALPAIACSVLFGIKIDGLQNIILSTILNSKAKRTN